MYIFVYPKINLPVTCDVEANQIQAGRL